MNNDAIIRLVFGKNATKELSKILDFRDYPEKSDTGQLAQASQTLTKEKMDPTDKWEPPFNWEADEWERLCNLSHISRVGHAASFLSIEFKRLEAVIIDEEGDKSEYAHDEEIDFEEELTTEDLGLETPKEALNLYVNAEEVKPIDEEMREASKRGKHGK